MVSNHSQHQSPPNPWVPVGVFFAAFAIRMIYLLEICDTHLLASLMGDGELFDLWGQKIAGGQWLGEDIFFQAPFYPYFLGIVYAVFGRDLFVLRVIQAVIGAGACALLAVAGTRFFSKNTGWVAGILLAVYPVAVYYDGLVQKAVFGLFFMALLLMLLGWVLHSPKPYVWLSIGVCLGLFVLTRENALIFLMVVVFWVFVHFRSTETLQRRAIWAVLILVGSGLVLFPVAVRNKVVGGEFVLTTSNLGYNLYVGNNRHATGTYSPMVWGRGDWRYELDDAVRLAESQTGRSLSASEVSGFWTRKALADIIDYPWSWMRLIAKKGLLIWNDTEISDTESIYAYQRWSHLLWFFGKWFSFGTLFALAVVGMALTWQLRRKLWLLYMALGAYAASIGLFFVFARYRQPMVAILTLFAAAGIIEVVQLMHRRNHRRLAASLAVFSAAALFSYRPIIAPELNSANTFYNWGTLFEERKELTDAHRFYESAVSLNPRHVMALNNLGIVSFQLGRPEQAKTHFRRAIELEPDLSQLHRNYGMVLIAQGRMGEALISFKKAVRHSGNKDPVSAYNIACIYSRRNDVGRALSWLAAAVDSGYRDFEKIETDADLKNLRNSSAYSKFIKKVRSE